MAFLLGPCLCLARSESVLLRLSLGIEAKLAVPADRIRPWIRPGFSPPRHPVPPTCAHGPRPGHRMAAAYGRKPGPSGRARPIGPPESPTPRPARPLPGRHATFGAAVGPDGRWAVSENRLRRLPARAGRRGPGAPARQASGRGEGAPTRRERPDGGRDPCGRRAPLPFTWATGDTATNAPRPSPSVLRHASASGYVRAEYGRN